MKAIADEKLAKFVEDKVKEIDDRLLKVGAHMQQSVREMEFLVEAQFELKRALRDGVFQPAMWPAPNAPIEGPSRYKPLG